MKQIAISIHHIFIFCDNHDEVAQELLDFGFTEGSNRIHPGQGTRNRKFYFKNFFLEILWVHNDDEVTNTLTSSVKLYQRSLYATNSYSPFGLCLNYDTIDDTLFERAIYYKPIYLPTDMVIEVLTNDNSPSLPWTFRWKSGAILTENSEYVTHDNGIENLTKASFYVTKNEKSRSYIEHFRYDKSLSFKDAERHFLELEFDNGVMGSIKVFENFPLQIKY